MTRLPTIRCLSLLGLIVIAGLLVTGCVIRDPQALIDIGQARQAIDTAKKASAAERYPDDYAALEKRYLEARGVFYACRDDEASRLAKALIADANALAGRRAEAPPPPPPPPANRPPTARLQAPAEGEINELLAFSGEGSSDPDGDRLTYNWDFGDGTTTSFTVPSATHRYAKIGNYTVRLAVNDGRGGTDTTSKVVVVVKREVIRSDVLFDFDKSVLKPAAERTLGGIVQQMKNEPTLRADIVGHTDGIGTEEYNMGLSKRRAEAVRNHKVAKGIAATRLSVSWKGKTQPVAPNTTDEGRAQNRRVEITLRPPAP